MPRDGVTEVQRALLRADIVIRGTLGEKPVRPNIRVFRTSNGDPVSQLTVMSLLERGLLKVVRTSGEAPSPREIYYTVTEQGRVMGQHGRTVGTRWVHRLINAD